MTAMRMTSDSAALSAYRTKIAHATVLAPSVEQDLARRSKKGDLDAARRLVEGCLSFVLMIAVKYRRWGVAMEDLVQEGNIGLLKAIDRFDPDRGVRLATYAAFWIRAEIRDFLLRQYRIVRLGSSKEERRALRVYRTTHEQRPEVLSAMTGLSVERVEKLLPVLTAGDVSLSASPHDLGPSLQDRLADTSSSAEDALCDADEHQRLKADVATAISGLSLRQQDIVGRRLLADQPMTLEELGTAWGVTRERVRQIEEQAKKRMRESLQRDAGDDTGSPRAAAPAAGAARKRQLSARESRRLT